MGQTDTTRTNETRTALQGTIPAQRTATTASARCSCGHGPEAHEHYRPGNDCSQCDCTGRGRSLATLLVSLLDRRG